MRYVTTIVWQGDARRGLRQWLVLLSLVLSGRALAGGESGIGVPKLDNFVTIDGVEAFFNGGGTILCSLAAGRSLSAAGVPC